MCETSAESDYTDWETEALWEAWENLLNFAEYVEAAMVEYELRERGAWE